MKGLSTPFILRPVATSLLMLAFLIAGLVSWRLLPATLAFAVSALLAALIRLMNLWLNGRLAAVVGSDLSCEAYRRTLYQPYRVHVQRNSSELITDTTTQKQARQLIRLQV